MLVDAYWNPSCKAKASACISKFEYWIKNADETF